ncbi:MAG: DM13 domain-containing protein [Motiliproteus sp.]|nr:DM13 domain-containing protein [Motiliproteus sp.]MCW9052982.1 DM13 domain-containing protein [Motiliproteus sp.]
MKKLLLLITHLAAGFAGFALGIYLLPILTAPSGPTDAEISVAKADALLTGEFRKDLRGSDFLHWGEGILSVGSKFISLAGSVAPGPDYKLYLSPKFVEDEAEFNQLKSQMVRVGDIKVFENFIVPVPETIDINDYDTAVVWCETFGEFITATRYGPQN